ncbi:MAG: HindIII family type II restriction endonuclease [Nitrospirota bacterium]
MIKIEIITKKQIERRNYWIDEICRLSGNFGVDAEKVEEEISQEIKEYGIDSLLGHLRLCGVIPEKYGHDTSEEKLYSKYTDVIIHEAYLYMGFNSMVLKDRSDVADVECVNNGYGFVADAKAFRLSRTAKNQKDFKVQAMDGWKHGKLYAMADMTLHFYSLYCLRY